MKVLLSGNEAFARGAYEYGVKVATAYPGTPSSEILKNIAQYQEIYSEWSTNEKVALEVAIGASIGGGRALSAMKSAGANVACDPLVGFAYTGVNAGMVIIICGDPGMASSSTEQDDRYFAKLAGLPILEPSNSAEAKEFVGIALDLSEKFDIPVIIRSTTGLSHSKSEVELGERQEIPGKGFQRNTAKYSLLPGFARTLRSWLIERQNRLSEYAETFHINKVEEGSKEIGIISSGMAYQSAKEVMPDASFLKLGMTNPLPMYRIKKFSESVKHLFVVEELEPFIEEQILAAGIKVEGKAVFSREGELTPEAVARGFIKAGFSLPRWEKVLMKKPEVSVPRVPVQCSGCPHRAMSMALKKLDVNVTGDIGCYDLITLPPIQHMHTVIEMGCSIGAAVGASRVDNNGKKTVAIIGDSTFLHSGMTGLLNATYNKADITVVILNNGITAMTGGQYNPGTEYTLMGEETTPVDIVEICKSLGVKYIQVVDAYDYEKCLDALKSALDYQGPSVIMTNRPCMLFPVKYEPDSFCVIDSDKCNACQLCIKQTGCPSLVLTEETNSKGKQKAGITIDTCMGCTVCAQICPSKAIGEVKKHA
ncbi:MAG: thiamine pyrophosphate-dependent enzyme [Bacillota bacterium]|jgi:indolepyruvate ferredoxin oxidoreductase alpha subunit